MNAEKTAAQSKLICSLKAFSRKEYSEFGKLVRSPFFNTGRNLYPLYTLLGKYHPDFESRRANENLTKEKIFEKLYPGGRFNEKKSTIILRKLFSDLNKQAEKYLLLVALRNHPFEKERLLTGELIRRNQDASYKKHIRKIDEYLKARVIDEYYFRQMADAENLKYNFNLLRKDRQEMVTENVIKKGEYNIINSLLMLSEAMHDAGVNHRTFNSPYKETTIHRFAENINLTGFIDKVKNDSTINTRVIKTSCYELLNILNPGNKEIIFRYRDMVEKNLHLYSGEMQKNLFDGVYSMMINARLSRESFDAARFMLEKGMYHTDTSKPFPLIFYKNLIRGALRNNEYEWTESFVESYHKELSPEYRQDMRHYGLAYLHWNKGNYENVLAECSLVSTQNINFITDIKILTLMVYYETGGFESALYLIDSLRLYFKQNKKISSEIDLYYSGFLKIVKILIKKKMGESVIPVEKIKSIIENSRDMYALKWLSEKIAAFA